MLGWIRSFEQGQVFRPSREVHGRPEDFGLSPQQLWLKTPDGERLQAWYLAPGPSASQPRHVLLYAHGNAGNLSCRLPQLRLLRDMGIPVLMFDYRGYGESSGQPDEQGLVTDAETALDALLKMGWRPEQVVLLGKSLGGAVVTALGNRREVGGLILQSTFTSVRDMARVLFPWFPIHLFCRIRFETQSLLKSVQVPVMILHSPEDRLVPFEQAMRNLEASPAGTRLIRLEGGHNDTFRDCPGIWMDAVQSFLASLPAPSA